MKIAIYGYSGSGKSTLARRLGEYHQMNVLHFDSIQFLPGWKIRDEEDKKAITKEFMDTHDAWVIDGNYSKLYSERRLEEADLIVLMLFNRLNCLYRVIKRYMKYKNETRPDMGAGCIEKLDLEFVWWILHEGRTKRAKEKYRNICKKYPEKVVVIRNQKELDRWMERYFND